MEKLVVIAVIEKSGGEEERKLGVFKGVIYWGPLGSYTNPYSYSWTSKVNVTLNLILNLLRLDMKRERCVMPDNGYSHVVSSERA